MHYLTLIRYSLPIIIIIYNSNSIHNLIKTMRTTRSSTRTETFSNFMTDILPILVSEERLDVADVASLQQTCRTSNNILSSESSNDIWKSLETRIWPEVGRLVVSELDNNDIDNGDLEMGDGHQSKCATYRELFINYPSTWLTMEAARVQALPQWSKARHLHSKGGTLECGKCGCNCNGEDCPGIDIESEFRWERRGESLGYFSCRASVPAGEGYQMSGGTMVKLNRFCEPCFERMIELGETPQHSVLPSAHVKREDYERVAGSNLFEATTNYVMNEEGRDPYPPDCKHGGNCFYCDPFFTSTSDFSWQRVHRVDSDDAAIVIAHALIQPNCVHKHLNIAALHFNATIGELGYKALAYAMAVNTSLRSITMLQDECYSGRCVSDDQYDCSITRYHYSWERTPYKDSSNGLFEKALLHNQTSNLQKLRLCYVAFGERTLLRLDSFMKDEKKVAAKRKRECDGM